MLKSTHYATHASMHIVHTRQKTEVNNWHEEEVANPQSQDDHYSRA